MNSTPGRFLLGCLLFLGIPFPATAPAAAELVDRVTITEEEPQAPGDILLIALVCHPKDSVYSIRAFRFVGSRMGAESRAAALKYEAQRQPLLSTLNGAGTGVFLNGLRLDTYDDAHKCILPREIEITTAIDFGKPFVFEESGSRASGLKSIITSSPVYISVTSSKRVVAVIPDVFQSSVVEVSADSIRICPPTIESNCRTHRLSDLHTQPLAGTGIVIDTVN